MDAIKEFLEWVAQDSGSALATAFPFLLLGLAALYLAWLVIGYLRVSQVGLTDTGHGTPPPRAALPAGSEAPPRGVPYCPIDGLRYPPGARFCAADEGDLVLDCRTCGTTVSAGAAACYRCGTPTGVSDVELLS